MESFHRRQILGLGLGAMVPSAHAAFGSPLAFQIFSVRAQAAKDFPGTLRQVRDFDYRAVELVSFPGYSGSDARNGFGPLATLAPATVAKIIRDAGLSVAASHFKLEEFHDDRPIEWAKAIGLKYMTISDVPVAADMDAWKKIFERLNQCAERVRKAGMRLGFHTNFDSWKTFDGVMVMDALLRAVPPQNVEVQLDLATTVSRNVDAAEFLKHHGKRVFSMHLRDGRKPAQPGSYVYALALGQGEVDWKSTLAAARRAGVRNYVVEMAMEPSSDPLEGLRQSAQFLRSL